MGLPTQETSRQGSFTWPAGKDHSGVWGELVALTEVAVAAAFSYFPHSAWIWPATVSVCLKQCSWGSSYSLSCSCYRGAGSGC